MGADAMILAFWMLSFKPAFSLSSFTLIKRLFSFFLTFCHKGGVTCTKLKIIGLFYLNIWYIVFVSLLRRVLKYFKVQKTKKHHLFYFFPLSKIFVYMMSCNGKHIFSGKSVLNGNAISNFLILKNILHLNLHLSSFQRTKTSISNSRSFLISPTLFYNTLPPAFYASYSLNFMH